MRKSGAFNGLFFHRIIVIFSRNVSFILYIATEIKDKQKYYDVKYSATNNRNYRKISWIYVFLKSKKKLIQADFEVMNFITKQ